MIYFENFVEYVYSIILIIFDMLWNWCHANNGLKFLVECDKILEFKVAFDSEKKNIDFEDMILILKIDLFHISNHRIRYLKFFKIWFFLKSHHICI